MGENYDVLIVGGGLNGATLALALASAGIRPALIDAGARGTRSDPDFDGRAYALSASSRRMLAALGLWARVGGDAQEISGIKISDGRAGEGAAPWYLGFDGGEIDDGPMGHMLEDRHLRRALFEALDAAGVVVRERARVVAQ